MRPWITKIRLLIKQVGVTLISVVFILFDIKSLNTGQHRRFIFFGSFTNQKLKKKLYYSFLHIKSDMLTHPIFGMLSCYVLGAKTNYFNSTLLPLSLKDKDSQS